jgi:aromatic ring-cleaving dioxygenase
MQDERHKRSEARIGDMEKTMQEVVQLNTKFATLLEQQEKEVNDHEARLEKIEGSDSKWMDQIKIWIGAGVVTAVMNVLCQAVGV